MDVAAIKQGQRAMWAMGDFPDIAKFIVDASREALDALGAEPGDRLLDIAAGTGNLSIPAAQLGIEVVGLDITPELLDVARARAAAAELEIEFIEGDAEELPFDDDSFQLVASVFGIIFAPRQDVAAAEITRVCAPGGRFAIAAWTPEGMNGKLFSVMGAHMPPPPPGIKPPTVWGEEQYVTDRFAPSGATMSYSKHFVNFTADSVDHWVAYNERTLGPLMVAKSVLEPQGKWDALRADLVSYYSEFNTADDGSFNGPAEYLVAAGTMPE
jgi:ubiquinone/menaquinone biosynthesis C-methylase UbiE